MIVRFGLDLSGLVLDTTNFATCIDSGNERAPVAECGHATPKRNVARLVEFGLVVERRRGPVARSYPGDRHDATQFVDVGTQLVTRRTLAGETNRPSPPTPVTTPQPTRTPWITFAAFRDSSPPNQCRKLLPVPSTTKLSPEHVAGMRVEVERGRPRGRRPRRRDRLGHVARETIPWNGPRSGATGQL